MNPDVSFSMHKMKKEGRKKKTTYSHISTKEKGKGEKGIGWFEPRICNFLHTWTWIYTAE